MNFRLSLTLLHPVKMPRHSCGGDQEGSGVPGKVPATKLDDVSSIPRAHAEKGEDVLRQVVL